MAPYLVSFQNNVLFFQPLSASNLSFALRSRRLASNLKFGFVPKRLCLFSARWWLRTAFFHIYCGALLVHCCFALSPPATRSVNPKHFFKYLYKHRERSGHQLQLAPGPRGTTWQRSLDFEFRFFRVSRMALRTLDLVFFLLPQVGARRRAQLQMAPNTELSIHYRFCLSRPKFDKPQPREGPVFILAPDF